MMKKKIIKIEMIQSHITIECGEETMLKTVYKYKILFDDQTFREVSTLLCGGDLLKEGDEVFVYDNAGIYRGALLLEELKRMAFCKKVVFAVIVILLFGAIMLTVLY